MPGSSDFQRLFQVWALSLLAALYLFRGMLEFPSTGWQPQTILTVVVGLGLLPTLAALAATTFSLRRGTITGGATSASALPSINHSRPASWVICGDPRRRQIFSGAS